MNTATTLLLVGLLSAPAARAAGSTIAGTWRGKMYGLPAVVLRVKDEGGTLSGTITFYFLHRKTESDPWEVDTKHANPLPLLDAKFDGKALSFQVSHKEAHPPRTLNDPPSSFQLQLTGEGQAALRNLTEDAAAGRKDSKGFTMVRDPR